jgi:transcriptional regulator with XRE-family HTH domain
MNYITEEIASNLKAARESRGLSQRALSEKSGVPQGHISKIENGAVDLRLSSLVALARALDLELALVPRKAVPAVKSIVRSGKRGIVKTDSNTRMAHKELSSIKTMIDTLSKNDFAIGGLEKLQRQMRELGNFQFAQPDLEVIKNVNEAMKAFQLNTDSLDIIRQSETELQKLRNTLAHSSVNLPKVTPLRPAYSLEEDDNG